ncbi:FliI/YscN family ATPase [Breoghania sp.]|uniref:FliI/YscN family ATPase n=1 Tax=Breoghania sp. TaxID=2065378 RepID=UPI002617039E|nr:FliI/YscN family ATPase [Breoghania sp.]MDJ0931899.1 FliI/YscN family ATPase [Breoghania sp.]
MAVIGLIGERGREVAEFVQNDLGEEGLNRAVVIVATSDESALMRRQAAYLTLATAEFFCDQGLSVLCMMDSVTRFAMAQREIGLAAGELPISKGVIHRRFSPNCRDFWSTRDPGWSDPVRLRGFITVLVEGDSHNEPVADAVRGILDGHIVMERAIAERGLYPAINVLKSVFRTMPGCVQPEALPIIREAKRLMSTYADMEELIRLGAYRRGSYATVGLAIDRHDALEAFLDREMVSHPHWMTVMVNSPTFWK